MDLRELFWLAMKREIQPIEDMGSVVVNLGAGRQDIPNAINLDYPEWDATKEEIPLNSESVDTVLAFHFLEHLTGTQAIQILREIQRILKPDGHVLICVPHSSSIMAYQDLDHKSFYNEETFKILFHNQYYTQHTKGWQFKIVTTLIIGLVSRNLALLVQLRKHTP